MTPLTKADVANKAKAGGPGLLTEATFSGFEKAKSACEEAIRASKCVFVKAGEKGVKLTELATEDFSKLKHMLFTLQKKLPTITEAPYKERLF